MCKQLLAKIIACRFLCYENKRQLSLKLQGISYCLLESLMILQLCFTEMYATSYGTNHLYILEPKISKQIRFLCIKYVHIFSCCRKHKYTLHILHNFNSLTNVTVIYQLLMFKKLRFEQKIKISATKEFGIPFTFIFKENSNIIDIFRCYTHNGRYLCTFK